MLQILSCCCCCCWVTSVMSNSVRPHRRRPTRLPHPWDSPSKNTGVGCHFLLQCMKVKSESEVAQSCLTLSDPMDSAYQAPPSMGFSRQEYWSGVTLPSPKHCPRFCKFVCCWVYDIMWVFPSFLNECVSENWCIDQVIFKWTKGDWYLWEFLRKIMLLCGRRFYKESYHILMCLLCKPVFPYVSFSSTGVPPVF